MFINMYTVYYKNTFFFSANSSLDVYRYTKCHVTLILVIFFYVSGAQKIHCVVHNIIAWQGTHYNYDMT